MRKNRYSLSALLLVILAVSLIGCDDNLSKTGVTPGEMITSSAEEIWPEEVYYEEEVLQEDLPEVTYILNTNSRKFHKPSCRSVELMKPENVQETSASREEVLEMGYKPCGNCNP